MNVSHPTFTVHHVRKRTERELRGNASLLSSSSCLFFHLCMKFTWKQDDHDLNLCFPLYFHFPLLDLVPTSEPSAIFVSFWRLTAGPPSFKSGSGKFNQNLVTNCEVYAGLCFFFYFQKRVMRCMDSMGNHSFKSGLLSITVLTIVSTYCCVKCNSCELHGESSSKVGPMYRSYRTLSELQSEPNKAGKLLRSSKEINSYTRLWESHRFSSSNTDFGN